MRVPVTLAFRHQLHCKARPDHWCHRRVPAAANPAFVSLIPRFYDATEGHGGGRSWAAMLGTIPVKNCAARQPWSCRRPSYLAAPSRSNLLWGNKESPPMIPGPVGRTGNSTGCGVSSVPSPFRLDEPLMEQGGPQPCPADSRAAPDHRPRPYWVSRKFLILDDSASALELRQNAACARNSCSARQTDPCSS